MTRADRFRIIWEEDRPLAENLCRSDMRRRRRHHVRGRATAAIRTPALALRSGGSVQPAYGKMATYIGETSVGSTCEGFKERKKNQEHIVESVVSPERFVHSPSRCSFNLLPQPTLKQTRKNRRSVARRQPAGYFRLNV